MKYSTYRFTLDLQKHDSQMSIAVFKHDTAVKLRISLTDGGKPYSITQGCRAVFHGKRPDDRELVEPCMIQGNTEIIYTFSDSTAAKEGVVNCQLRLYGEIEEDNALITAPRFTIVVDDRIVNDTDIELDDGETVQSALDKIIASENTRESNEYGLKDEFGEIIALGRTQHEQLRKEAEIQREVNEFGGLDAKGNEVIGRVPAEEARVKAEEIRNIYENGGLLEDGTQITGRTFAENARETNETIRRNHEDQRKTSELGRQEGENQRILNEWGGVDSDGSPIIGRVKAEALRASAETERDNFEKERRAWEEERRAWEEGRRTFETERIQSEANRDSAESARKKNENERLQNEENRVNAENQRAAQLGIHNTANDAHQDIRNSLNDLSATVKELMGADEETLKDIQDIVNYAEENKDLINGLVKSKVNVSDIVDNLITNDSKKVLSAAQGVELKNSIALVDAKAKEVDNKVPSLAITGKLRHVYLYDSNKAKNSSMPAKTGYEGSEETDTIVSRGSPTNKNHPGTFEIIHPEMDEKKEAYSAKHPMTVGTAERRYAKKTELNSYATVAQLEALKAELTFVPFEITSLSVSPSTVEINEETTVTLHFELNKPFSGLKFNNETPDASRFTYADDLKSGSYTVPCQPTSTMTFTLEATCGKDDQEETATAKTSLSVSRQLCYGAYGDLDSTSATRYQALFEGLANANSDTVKTTHYSTTRYFIFTAAPTSEQYFYCLVPTRLGTCKFVAGNFPAQLSLMATGKDEEGKDIYTVNITNSNNYEESYYVYRSDAVGSGVTTEITVSGG